MLKRKITRNLTALRKINAEPLNIITQKYEISSGGMLAAIMRSQKYLRFLNFEHTINSAMSNVMKKFILSYNTHISSPSEINALSKGRHQLFAPAATYGKNLAANRYTFCLN